MNKKLAFAAGFISGNLFLSAAIAYQVHKIFGGFSEEDMNAKLKESMEESDGFKYMEALMGVVWETHPDLLNDPRLEQYETNLFFNDIIRNLHKEGDDGG